MTRFTRWRLPVAATMTLLLIGVVVARSLSAPVAAQDATPAAFSCEDAATPVPGMDGTPMAGTETAEHDMAGMIAEFDQLYIDMMIPHHAGIVALSETALPRLQDEQLVMLAEGVIAAQTAEITELMEYREQWYGSPEPRPIGSDAMMELMPGGTTPMDEMMAQMDPATQVALFCAAPDPNLAFIDLVIPHHVSAIETSQAALERAVHPEIRDFARRVIDAQEREIAELRGIRLERYGSATPEPVGM